MRHSRIASVWPLIEAWAMTETGCGAVVIANREPRQIGTACFGRPEERVEYRLIDMRRETTYPWSSRELLVRNRGARPRFGFFVADT
jgi:long-subunit acyl-CoA synthetase (AMP-forming)